MCRAVRWRRAEAASALVLLPSAPHRKFIALPAGLYSTNQTPLPTGVSFLLRGARAILCCFCSEGVLSIMPSFHLSAERDSGRRSPKCATHRPKKARGPRKTSGKWSLAFRLTQISRHRECRCEILVRSRVGAAKRALRITAHHRVNIHLPKGLGVEFPGRFEFMPIALRVPLARWYHLGVGAV